MRYTLPLLMIAPATAWADVPRVVTDIAPIHSLVSQVMGDLGAPDVLVSGAASPHDFQFTFDQAEAVQDADLIVWMGPQLTPWLENSLETLSADAPQLTLLDQDGWTPLELRDWDDHDHGHGHGDHGEKEHDDHGEEGHEDEGHDDHDDHEEHDDHEDHDDHDDHGHKDHDEEHADADHDDHGHDDHEDGEHAKSAIDPHAWLDVQAASVWTLQIAETLADLDPENAETYRANADAAVANLSALDADLTQQLQGLADVPFFVPHDAYQYFGARYDVTAVGAISLSDANAPTPDMIAELQERVAEESVVCVLSDPQTREDWVTLVREGSVARTALADPIGTTISEGPDHYETMMRALGDAYLACLKG